MISPAPPYITSARLVSQLGGRVGSSTFASHIVVLVWCVLYTYIYVWWLVLYSIIIVYYFWKQLWLSKLRCSDQVIHLCQREECKNGSEQCVCGTGGRRRSHGGVADLGEMESVGRGPGHLLMPQNLSILRKKS